MIIRKIEQKDITSLINFNIKSYKNRIRIEESIYYRFFHNPFGKNQINEILIAEDKDKNIIGQALIMPTRFSFGGKEFRANWEMDNIVDESFRGLTGVVLIKNALKVENHFGLGLTKVGLALHLSLGEKVAGYLPKYIRLNHIFPILKFLFFAKNDIIRTDGFPESLNVSGGKFKSVHSIEDIVPVEGYWNSDVIEFTRSNEFLNWRFFYYPDKYIFYKFLPDVKENEHQSSYFVVRPIVFKRFNCLLLVDYRFPLKGNGMFEKILKATSFLAKEMRIPATIIGCSLPSCSRGIMKNGFLRFGKKLAIVTTFKNHITNIDSKNGMVFVTFADSDCEFSLFG